MNKALLKDFAINSREELMNQVRRKLSQFYISEEFVTKRLGDLYELRSKSGKVLRLTAAEYKKREALVRKYHELKKLGGNIEDQIVEEAAYTWFNRLVAIRYMELHDFLPLGKNNESLGIRVLSSKADDLHPEILQYHNLTNTRLDINFDEKVYQTLTSDKDKFKYLLQLICEKLKNVFPNVFGEATEFIDILIPENLLVNNGFVDRLIHIPKDNFDQVEIIGWLYQYYNSTEKDKATSSKKVYQKNQIPYVTQLFTPDWIVKYMVENSLGRYWLEHGGDEKLTQHWQYYIKTGLEVKNRIKPTEITFIDPCCGSGHILVYAFEIFLQIYESAGYTKKDIPSLILQNNLYGLDIDDRAGQLSVLSLLLKAREYDSEIFNAPITKQLHVMALKESGQLDQGTIDDFPESLRDTAQYLRTTFAHAKEIGSLLKVEPGNYDTLMQYCQDHPESLYMRIASQSLTDLVKEAKILSQNYDLVVTNPPYMGRKSFSNTILSYLKQYYPDGMNDLCTAFMQFAGVKAGGMLAMINQQAWMFKKTYTATRLKLLNDYSILSMVHMGMGAFGSDFGTTAFVASKTPTTQETIFIKLETARNVEDKRVKFLEDLKKSDYYQIYQKAFLKIPDYIICYWMTKKDQNIMDQSSKLSQKFDPKKGFSSGNNDKFIRLWFEVENTKLFKPNKWIPLTMGGDFRRYYGNTENVVEYENDGENLKKFKNAVMRNTQFYYRDCLSWNDTSSSGKLAVRMHDYGTIPNASGPCVYANDVDDLYYLLGFLNSSVAEHFIACIAPRLKLEVGQISLLPTIIDDAKKADVIKLVQENVAICKSDWDAFELSWDFTTHPLVKARTDDALVASAFKNWSSICDQNFAQLKANEEKLNRIFIEIYDLQDELSADVNDDDITIRKADEKREIKSFISYAVGCMFGRYSLDQSGLVCAGGLFSPENYQTFSANRNNIIPIGTSEDIYFNEDIVARFKDFLTAAFGAKTLDQNLSYIAEVLGRRGTESSDEAIRRYILTSFYADHIKAYQKTPIYWLLDSGKQSGFKALIYLHRYDSQLLAKIRTEYFHKAQGVYANQLGNIDLIADVIKRDKKKKELTEKNTECRGYDEKLAHLANQNIRLNLDDGVKVNYDKLKTILAKIK